MVKKYPECLPSGDFFVCLFFFCKTNWLKR
uniref:Uncharacterized protein n=1 Tax=Anguilla anguilla TaxID=7936 RepID=A0A0E9QVC6_ANGAN